LRLFSGGKEWAKEVDGDRYFLEVTRNGDMEVYFFEDMEELRELEKIIDGKRPVSREKYAAIMEDIYIRIRDLVRKWMNDYATDDMIWKASRVKCVSDIFDMDLVYKLEKEFKSNMHYPDESFRRIKEEIVLYLVYHVFKSYGVMYF
jgi:hypothetical protein